MAFPTSQGYKNAILLSGGRKTVVDLYYNRNTTPIAQNLPVISGSLTIDSQSAQRRSGTITLASSELITDTVPLTIEPYGVEIGIRMGVVYPGGKEELVPVGKFIVTDVSWSDDGGEIPTLTFQDRSSWWEETTSGTGFADFGGKSTMYAIRELLKISPFTTVTASLDAYTDATTVANNEINMVIDSSLSDFLMPTGTPAEAPFWDDIQQYAGSIGAELFFDVDGVNVILRTIPVVDSSVSDADVDFLVTPGTNLISATRGRSRDGSYNAVLLTGQQTDDNADNAGLSPSVFVYDNDPNSRTWFYGPFGQRVYRMTSDTVSDNTTLYEIATLKLKTLLGLSRSLSLSCLPDPSMDAGDILKVSFLDGTSEYHLVKSITLDLTWAGPMSVETISPNSASGTLELSASSGMRFIPYLTVSGDVIQVIHGDSDLLQDFTVDASGEIAPPGAIFHQDFTATATGSNNAVVNSQNMSQDFSVACSGTVSAPPGSGPSWVQTTSGGSTAGTGTVTTSAFSSSTASGGMIVVTVATDAGVTSSVTSVTDSKGNTYTQIIQAASNTTTAMFYAKNITGGSAHTVTAHFNTGNTTNCALIAMEVSGASTTAPLDQSTSNSGSGTSETSGATATTTAADELVIGGVSFAGTTAPTLSPGSGYENFTRTTSGGSNANCGMETKSVTSTGTQTATFTNSASRNYTCIVATFK